MTDSHIQPSNAEAFPSVGPFDLNEHGLWCPACGEIIAAPWNMGNDYIPPDHCKTCGFPDFEDGHGYFTDG